MSAQHTPGPWEVGEDDRNGQAIVRGEHIEIATCWHHCVGSIEKEMRANAVLIAAAPDMLATLDRYADTLCEGWCKKSPDCAHFDDCGGCEARRVAGKALGHPSQKLTSNGENL